MQLSVEQMLELAIRQHRVADLAGAEQTYRLILAVQPLHCDALHLLGVLTAQAGQPAGAGDLIRRSIAINPKLPLPHFNLANALKQLGNFDDAILAYQTAIELDPRSAGAHNNLGMALREAGRFEEAAAAIRQAVALRQDYGLAHYNLGLLLLAQGKFHEGWIEQEWRWVSKSPVSPLAVFTQPQWDASDLNGRTILLFTEQGLGDAIQFIRYMPMVAGRKSSGKIIVRCAAQLRRLFAGIQGVDQWIGDDNPLPLFDVYCPLMSLPMVFGTTPQTIPWAGPYLHADPDEVGRWQKELETAHRVTTTRRSLKVGLVWAGNPAHLDDRKRSLSLADFAALGEVTNAVFFSLQRGEPARQTSNPPHGMKLIDRSVEWVDLADTAAFIANLDLVITADTAMAHLAGAMGKPVWTLIPFVPDWRWRFEGEQTPWYPSMRLFRQKSRGNWKDVLRTVAGELRKKPDTNGTNEHD